MTRIGREHHNNWIQRTPNYSYAEADTHYVSGESISATMLYGPPIATHNKDCPTNTQAKSTGDPTTLKINSAKRRPFFEDQYSWVKGPYEASGYALAKYLGSGALKSDEIQTYILNGGGDILLPTRTVSGTYEAIVSGADADGWPSWFGQFEKDAMGIVENTVGNNTIYTAGMHGHLVNRWLYKVRPGDRNADAIIAVKDGTGFGQQNFGDLQTNESFGMLQDEISFPAIASINLDDGYPAFSGIAFHPPLPKAYLNPIVDTGLQPYKNTSNLSGASVLYPEYWQSKPHTCASVVYSKRTTAPSSLTIETAYIPAEFQTELAGGDLLSGTILGSFYWDQYGSGTGFAETAINKLEGGGLPALAVLQRSFLKYRKTIVDFGGDGITREVYGTYRNHAFSYENYLDSDAFYRDGGAEIPEAIKTQYIEYFGQATSAYSEASQFAVNESIANFIDPRFNEMHLYSPETEKILTYSQVSAASVTILNGATIDLSSGTPRYFNAYPDIPYYPGIGESLIKMNFVDDTNLSHAGNSIILTGMEGSGTGNSPQPVSYYRKIVPTDEEWLGSNQVMVITERTSGAPGDLPTAAMGVFTILNSSKNQNARTSGWLAPNNVIARCRNQQTSGIYGTSAFGGASNYAYDSSAWGNDVEGSTLNDRHGTPYGTIGAGADNTSYVPKGWNFLHSLTILGEDKDDVISKLTTFLANNTWDQYIYAEDELPDVLLNYEQPLKAGNIN